MADKDDKKKPDGEGKSQGEKPPKKEKPQKAEGAPAEGAKPEKKAKPEGAPAGAEGGEKKKKEGGEKKRRAKDEANALTTLASDDDAPARSGPPRLLTLYRKEIAPKLMKEFSFTNPMQVPRLVKITINMGLGEAISNPKLMDSAVEELRAMSGQKPVVTKAKKSIATFKLREGQKIGCMVTLRREKMWEFLDRLVSLALPRVRDFKGISPRSFDGRGNFSMGIREQIIFPEINYDKIDKIKGLNVSIVTTARTDDEGRALLKHLGMPFRAAAGKEAGASE
jgi:large subunit ribosomal protein L5